MKKIIATLLIAGGVGAGADAAVFTPQELQNEPKKDYAESQAAQPFVVSPATLNEDLKEHIIESLIEGTHPNIPGDVIPLNYYNEVVEEAAEEMGIDVKEMYKKKFAGEDVNLAKEIRIKAQLQGRDVKRMKKD